MTPPTFHAHRKYLNTQVIAATSMFVAAVAIMATGRPAALGESTRLVLIVVCFANAALFLATWLRFRRKNPIEFVDGAVIHRKGPFLRTTRRLGPFVSWESVGNRLRLVFRDGELTVDARIVDVSPAIPATT
ncbi:MAG: hypothetical protein H0V44_02045 [Planctomycetes bacterium]|nr:hypothetical protein [Planctomycetota bacterium]